jgi:replicative DNA helicase
MLDETRQIEVVELEQALLGRLILNPDQVATASGILPEGAFVERLHGRIFETMQAKQAAGEAITTVTLATAHAGEMAADDLPVRSYLARLLANAPATGSVAHLAREIAEQAVRRWIMQAAADASQELAENVAAADVAARMLDATDRALQSVAHIKRGPKVWADAVRDTIDDVLDPNHGKRITTGLRTLDAVIGGLHCGEFAILAGRPGMGKSTVAVDISLAAAKSGHGVVFFSFEMASREIVARALANLSTRGHRPLQYAPILRGQLSDAEQQVLIDAGRTWRELPISVDDQRGQTLAQIASRVRREQQARKDRNEPPVSLVVVDHLGLIRVSDRYRGNRVHEVSEISAGLAEIANANDVAMLALSQLNRAVESRDNKRPGLSDLRDSGSLEQDAHMCMFAYRPEYYLQREKYDDGSEQEYARLAELQQCKGELDLIIAKNRNGPTDCVTLHCDIAAGLISDLGAP